MQPICRGPTIATATVVALLLAACTASGSADTPSAHDPSRSESNGACTDTTVRKLVIGFVRAFNAGDQPTLQRIWARQGNGFDWYITDGPGQRIGSVAQDRAGLERYFAGRHEAGERLRLTSFQFNGNTAGYGNFQYTLIRRADDLAPTKYTGKGAAICTSTRSMLGVWSMAKTPTPRAKAETHAAAALSWQRPRSSRQAAGFVCASHWPRPASGANRGMMAVVSYVK
ncbi:hypothetical protein [Flexivirga oryzae]|uniref:Nuclear transport factor 2 family protein n=1 Tax=Flexivirga oryzae TaxID=1794944 RepID=A0A839N7E9_9MICO|nr:hypothetical protein [Flexivirga oryzae]MBB2892063.1 hypothetical protein [Flexivirga oryzae]